MTRQAIIEVLRTVDALSRIDDWQPEHYAELCAAAQVARDEVGRWDRNEARKAERAVRIVPRKPARRPDPPELRAAKTVVHERSGGYCEARTAVCNHYAEHIHHIARRRGKQAHAVANLLDVCQPCHLHIHANPEQSYEAGWLVRSGALPPVTDNRRGQ